MARKKNENEASDVVISGNINTENKSENIEIIEDTKTHEITEPISEQAPEWVYNPNGKTYVRNVSNIGISVILENTVGRRGEVHIPPKQARPISNEEIMIKYESQNPSFCGTDGVGTNASLYIEDEGFRRYLSFETCDKKQEILSEPALERIINTESLSAFKKLIECSVKTYAEKDKLLSYLREKHKAGKFDSASKIDFVEAYTNLKIKE